MKFDKRITLIKENLEPDGMGGYIEQGETQVGTIMGFTTPVTAEIMLREHGIVTTTAMKIFTQSVIDEENFQIEYADRKFEVLQMADYGKFRMLLVQEIEENE
jgi:hypothetical protein